MLYKFVLQTVLGMGTGMNVTAQARSIPDAVRTNGVVTEVPRFPMLNFM